MGACGSCSAEKDVVDTADVAIDDAKPVKEPAARAAAAPAEAEAAKVDHPPTYTKKSSSTISLGAEPDMEDAFVPSAQVGDFRPVSPSQLKAQDSGPSLIKLNLETVAVTGGVRLALKIEPSDELEGEKPANVIEDVGNRLRQFSVDIGNFFGDMVKVDPEAEQKKKVAPFVAKMKAGGCSKTAIDAFTYNFGRLTSGESLFIAEDAIERVAELPLYESLSAEDPALLTQTVMLKLNGGLGTGMGLEKAKSLLPLKDGNTFLDFIAKQVGHMRGQYATQLAFLLMNSFATSKDTLEHLAKYDALGTDGLPLEFVQNKAPKVAAADLSPAEWPARPECEWCPPGHGDLYPAMVGTGTLDALLEKGLRYMFVSNSDNLGATMDLKLLTWFARSGAPFAMEVAGRTDADKKGGHLARSRATGGLLLRESAQCTDADAADFQNVGKHQFFNTNNLWVDLQALKAAYDKEGVLKLPVIQNAKTVDPRDKGSTKVLQLETAMGAAIECFEGAGAIVIPRSRFAPVKTTSDMLALMSDAYEVTADHRMALKGARAGVPPNVKLDGMYKFVDQLQTLVPSGPPSLIGCDKLTVEGSVAFAAGVVFQGAVTVVNRGAERKTLAAGTYADASVDLTSELAPLNFGPAAAIPGLVGGEKGKPAVIVIQEWWGVTDLVKAHAARVARAGFRVLVPDIYKGKIGVDAEEAHHLMSNLDFPAAVEEIGAAAAHLKAEGSPKVGVVGFCMGGALAMGSLPSRDIACAAPFYGVNFGLFSPEQVADKPVQGHFGENDTMEGFSDAATAKKLEESLQAAGNQHAQIFLYPGVGHAFMNDSPAPFASYAERKDKMGFEAYDEAQAKIAWGRLVEFFQTHLK